MGLESFGEFWNQYPRKVAKKDAWKAWGRLNAEDQSAALAALPAHCRHWALNTSPEYVPYPASWLNGERWADELPPLEQSAGRQVAWWSSDEATMAKGRELGVSARPGEDMNAYRGRLKQAIVSR